MEFDDPQDTAEFQAVLGDVANFDLGDCLRRQLDSQLCDQDKLKAALDGHVEAGRISREEADSHLRINHSLGVLGDSAVKAFIQKRLGREKPRYERKLP